MRLKSEFSVSYDDGASSLSFFSPEAEEEEEEEDGRDS